MSKIIKALVIILAFITLFVFVYMYAKHFGTSGYYVKEYLIESESISEDYDGLKIAHLSDIHFDNDLNIKNFKKIIKDVNKKKPDIIVLTGDLLSDEISEELSNELISIMNTLEATSGKYIIDGNHDYKYKKWDELAEECGFTIINDTYEVIYQDSYDYIFLAGVSNNTYTEKTIEEKMEVTFNFMNSEEFNSTFNILLLHEPDFVKDIDYSKFDLILAGHSHNGQVRLPFIGAFYTPTHSKIYYKPYYSLETSDLYISSGIGTSELPVRLFNKPSYNFYRIIKKES